MAPTIDLVFSGGGTRGVAHGGALEVLEARRPIIKRLLGTSAGAIAAAFSAAGFTGKDYLKLVPEKDGDAFTFNSFFVSPPGQVVRDAAAKKDSETRKLLRGAVDGALDGVLKGMAEKRPRIGELISGVVAANKDRLYENAFLGFLDKAGERENHNKPRPRTSLFALIEFGGLFDPNAFRDWMPRIFGQRVPLIDAQMTLKQFHEATRDVGRELSVVTADTTDAKPLVLNHRSAPDCPVVEAVLMSLSVPLVWPEIEWKKEWGTYLGRDVEGHLMLDGGLFANLPIQYLLRREDEDVQAIFGPAEPEKERPAIIGLLLDGTVAVPGDVAPVKEGGDFKLIDRINRMLGTMSSWQAAHVQGAEELICHIGVKGHPALEMKPTPEAILRLQALVNSGRCAMQDYLKKRKLF